MKLLFTGDVNFRGKEGVTLQESKEILADVQSYVDEADFVILNLECPLADKEKYKPIKKVGSQSYMQPSKYNILKSYEYIWSYYCK